jgi:hypothetical protein
VSSGYPAAHSSASVLSRSSRSSSSRLGIAPRSAGGRVSVRRYAATRSSRPASPAPARHRQVETCRWNGGKPAEAGCTRTFSAIPQPSEHARISPRVREGGLCAVVAALPSIGFSTRPAPPPSVILKEALRRRTCRSGSVAASEESSRRCRGAGPTSRSRGRDSRSFVPRQSLGACTSTVRCCTQDDNVGGGVASDSSIRNPGRSVNVARASAPQGPHPARSSRPSPTNSVGEGNRWGGTRLVVRDGTTAMLASLGGAGAGAELPMQFRRVAEGLSASRSARMTAEARRVLPPISPDVVSACQRGSGTAVVTACPWRA